MKQLHRYILGYAIGIIIFLGIIPYSLYELSKLDYLFTNKLLFNNKLLRYIISSLFCIAGAIFMLWSNIYLFKIGKGGPAEAYGISLSPKTKKLVKTGPYRYSRNPMVFGALTFYVSIAILLNSITGLICLCILLFIAIAYLKFSEEKRLLRDFGNEYREYKKNVSMLLPRKNTKRKDANNNHKKIDTQLPPL
ncbi:MAG: isoprenylcysteine carboxylmethyltransferase family protein [Candidatus Cloacimonetes bacterium]|nr:isoprenylcysteine carboxylmethyltransferase family protein [Candidatus Cloacimonadota bacterium]